MTDLEIILGTGLVVAIIIGLYATMLRWKTPIVVKSDDALTEEQEKTKQQILAERARIVKELEAERGTKVITLIQRKEPWSKQDEDDEEYISIEDTEHILGEIHRTPSDKPIDLILHTPGGMALAAEMIASALYEHPAKTTVIVPFYAMSGGTLCALAADDVMMEKFSVLGPVDPQLDDMPSSSWQLVVQKKHIDQVGDNTVMMAHIGELSTKNMKFLVKQLLSDKMSEDQAEKNAEFLTGGYITHDTPLNIGTAKSLGLKVHEGVPEKVFELFTTLGFGVSKKKKRYTHRPMRLSIADGKS
jgi:ClpP class serine protease